MREAAASEAAASIALLRQLDNGVVGVLVRDPSAGEGTVSLAPYCPDYRGKELRARHTPTTTGKDAPLASLAKKKAPPRQTRLP
jgi:hypothetical protein